MELIKYETADLYGVKTDTDETLLTRAELEGLYQRIQDIKAAELIAAGWEEAAGSGCGRWFFLPNVTPFMTANPLDEAWRIMKEAANVSRN